MQSAIHCHVCLKRIAYTRLQFKLCPYDRVRHSLPLGFCLKRDAKDADYLHKTSGAPYNRLKCREHDTASVTEDLG